MFRKYDPKLKKPEMSHKILPNFQQRERGKGDGDKEKEGKEKENEEDDDDLSAWSIFVSVQQSTGAK